jgi:glucose/arabinose dehydrogenase
LKRFVLFIVWALMMVQPVAAQAPISASAYRLTPIADGFNRPLYVTHAGDGSNRLFVVEQGGRILILKDGVKLQTPFLDISSIISPEAASGSGYSERGLLGLAFHPDYADNGVFYINYTDREGTTIVARYLVSDSNPDLADPSSAAIVMTQPQPYRNHNGGHIAFGPDGYLYIGMGDGGSAGDPLGAGQDLNTLLGKLLRIDPGLDGGYTIPDDNPFVGSPNALPEIWAYGLRNPWRFSFDAQTGDLYMGDVGQNQWEEINFQPADSRGGENYGWNFYEGRHPYSGLPAPSNVVMPVAEYAHNLGVSVTGGYVYRGERIPALQGYYIYGDFGWGTMWALRRDAAGVWQNTFLADTNHTISSFGEDENRELYLVNYTGIILRFDPPA